MNIAAADILKAFNFRHATKSYDASKKVSDADFHTILEAGRLSPSSFGFEPWKFLVIERQDIKDKLFPLAWGAQNSLRGASHFVIVLARKKVDTLYSSPYITHIMRDVQHLPEDAEQGRKAAFEAFQKDDFNLLESDRAIFDWASKQTYLALANMMTTAAMLGIDSCPIEGLTAARSKPCWPKKVSSIRNISAFRSWPASAITMMNRTLKRGRPWKTSLLGLNKERLLSIA